jgi:hypothetical protein
VSTNGIIALVWIVAGVVAIAFVPALRQKFLWLYVEHPLRMITGRRLPNPVRIAQLERELLPHDRSET